MAQIFTLFYKNIWQSVCVFIALPQNSIKKVGYTTKVVLKQSSLCYEAIISMFWVERQEVYKSANLRISALFGKINLRISALLLKNICLYHKKSLPLQPKFDKKSRIYD